MEPVVALKRIILLTMTLGLLIGCTLSGGKPVPNMKATPPLQPGMRGTATPAIAAKTGTPPPPAATAVPPTTKPVLLTATVIPSTPTRFPDLDFSVLRQATLTLPETGMITLQDGRYVSGETRVILMEQVASGYLTYNGGQDAAALVSVNTGGSGNFVYLVAFYNEGGRPVQHGEAVFIEDRPKINKLAIWDGRIVLSAVLHWGDEPSCCPSKRVNLTFRDTIWGWRLERVATIFPDNIARRISLLGVETPANGVVRVHGLVTVMPFENTLNYRWVGEDGTVFAQGALMVMPNDPDEMGGSGHFDADIPLPGVPPNLDVALQIVDISMRDGSVLAQDTVWMTLR